MRRLLVLAFLPLAACLPESGTLAPPSTVSDRTVLDEKLALGVEAAYAASRSAMELAVDAGVLRGPAAATAAGIDRKAYAAVLATRSAYAAGNASSYISAAGEAATAVAQLLTIAKGPTT